MNARKPGHNGLTDLPDERISPCVRIFIESLLNSGEDRSSHTLPKLLPADEKLITIRNQSGRRHSLTTPVNTHR